MRLIIQLLIGYLLISVIVFYLIFSVFFTDIKPAVKNAAEYMLSDTAVLLSTMVSDELDSLDEIDNSHFSKSIENAKQAISAGNTIINGIQKKQMDYRVYITDKKGIVIFDSNGQDIGEDYSKWNDVYLTLQGQYGARITLKDESDPTTSAMYVAAPIIINGEIVGVLTVVRANRIMAIVMNWAENQILFGGLIWVFIAFVMGSIIMWRTNRSINKLTDYAQKAARHEVSIVPELYSDEFKQLALSLENMRLKLEGKDYIEKYIHSLTHELKSPLASIRAAVNILQDDQSGNKQTQLRFLTNIDNQSERMLQLVEQMLQLVRIESRVGINFELFNIDDIIAQLIEENQAKAVNMGINLLVTSIQPCKINGDKFLLAQAINNLISNALDFTPKNGTVEISTRSDEKFYFIEVKDNGTGIPNYALDKLYDRFYSLPRPNKSKSSGLGLPFVKEIAILHNGQIHIQNRQDISGVIATLSIQIK